MGKFNLMVFLQDYFISVFCDIIQFPEQGSVDFSDRFGVTAILHGLNVATVSYMLHGSICVVFWDWFDILLSRVGISSISHKYCGLLFSFLWFYALEDNLAQKTYGCNRDNTW